MGQMTIVVTMVRGVHITYLSILINPSYQTEGGRGVAFYFGRIMPSELRYKGHNDWSDYLPDYHLAHDGQQRV